jgi:hypothetical protein
VRKAGPAALAVQVALSLSLRGPAAAHADDASATGAMRVAMTCERVLEPGRVHCEVEARVEPGESIAWGDVVLLQVPPFATALRGRIGPHDASVREPALWRWSFAVVARAKGAGELAARVRVVVCTGREPEKRTCGAREVEVAGKVEVGEPKAP